MKKPPFYCQGLPHLKKVKPELPEFQKIFLKKEAFS